MPRPEPIAVPRLPLEYRVANVDAPDARYEVAWVQLMGQTVRVLDQAANLIGEYEFDAEPQFRRGSIVGLVGGMPLVVSKSTDCGCLGTQKAMKHAR